ncbi:MAG: LPS export ABC transporter permease LptG [Gammaproteobacteria bacterium]|nr:LPS export ABC transporter permease LptG [Gammaproteobacteria bacterium]
MSIIDRFIARNFLSGASIVLMILLSLFAFLTLAEALEDVGKGMFTTFDALTIVGYSLPRLMLDLLPVTALLGVLIGLGAMANNQELTVLRAAGYSVGRIAWPVVEVVIAATVIVLILQFFVVPDLELSAARVRAKTSIETTIVSDEGGSWTRSGNRFVRIGQIIQHGELRDVEIFALGEDAQLEEVMQATSVQVLDGGQWLLRDVTVTDLSSGEITEEHLNSKVWRSFLSAQQTSALIVPVEAMAPLALYRYIRQLDENDLDTHRYRVMLWQQLSIPIGLLAMALLGFPFLLGSGRAISAGQRAAIGGSIGILFYLFEQMIGHFAILFELSPAPAAFAPDLVLLTLALVILRRAR